jgi:hypothetical protein
MEAPAPATGTGNLQKAHQSFQIQDSSGSGQSGDNNTAATDYRVTSQQVSWWSVHEYIAAVLERRGCWPAAGTLSGGK